MFNNKLSYFFLFSTRLIIYVAHHLYTDHSVHFVKSSYNEIRGRCISYKIRYSLILIYKLKYINLPGFDEHYKAQCIFYLFLLHFGFAGTQYMLM